MNKKWVCDKVGNRISQIGNGQVASYTYNGLNQLTSSKVAPDGKPTVETTYQYDGKGNEIVSRTGDITSRKTYDVENRLTKVEEIKGEDRKEVQENCYNGDGQRLSKTEGKNQTNYFYEDGAVSATTNGEKLTSEFITGEAGNVIEKVAYKDGMKSYSFQKDMQGSIMDVLSEDGKADASYHYSDYGETSTEGENRLENFHAYTGGVYDNSTKLYYLNARYYHPEEGQFLSQDTYRGEQENPGTQNLYAYCHGNPVNYIDSSGHDAILLLSRFARAGHLAILVEYGKNSFI